MSDKTAVAGQDPTPGEAPARSLADALYDKFKGALALFGSVAAVSAFLIFAGFLSDYGAYQLAGLPRLGFSLTGMTESGADVAIDTLALLSQGTRVAWMLALLAALLWVWARHRGARLAPWVGSRPLQRAVWIVLLLLILNVFGGMVDRVSRSLSGEMHTAAALEESLTQAYASGIPDAFERQAAIERQGFELRFFRLPNAMVHVEQGWAALRTRLGLGHGVHASDETRGFALRSLPESRRDARHLFGWLTLSLLTLVVGMVLNGWWGSYLNETGAPEPAPPAGSPGWRYWLNADLDAAVARLVVPLSWGVALLAVALLPLLHGVLARQSIGAETVMVYLKPELGDKRKLTEKPAPSAASASKKPAESSVERESLALFPEPSDMRWPRARFDCSLPASADADAGRGDLQTLLDVPSAHYIEALRDYSRMRLNDGDIAQTRRALHQTLAEFADAVIDSQCAEAVALFYQAAPAPGLAAQAPEIAELFRRELMRVTTAYSVRLGTILSYPRDGQAMVLAQQVVPRHATRPGVWSLVGVKPESVGETVVLPDLARRAAMSAQAEVEADPDAEAAERTLLNVPRSESLRSLLSLLARQSLRGDSLGAAVTSIGAQAWVASLDQPRLATRTIDTLIELVRDAASPAWPNKSERLRGNGWSALHRTRSPYAAARVAALLGEQPAACGHHDAPPPDGVAPVCLGTAPTAIGYLLGELQREARLFSSPDRVPAALQAAIDTLERQLAGIVTSTTAGEEERTTACSALSLVGTKVAFSGAAAQALLGGLKVENLARYPLSSGACLENSNRVAIHPSAEGDAAGARQAFVAALRQRLRDIVEAPALPGVSEADRERLRRAAFGVLRELGLANETPFVFGLYVREMGATPLAQSLRKHLNTATAERLGGKFVACARDAERPMPQRVHCLAGVTHLKASFDGDDGATQAVLSLLAGDERALHPGACTALKTFGERGGLYARRALKHEAIVAARCALD